MPKTYTSTLPKELARQYAVEYIQLILDFANKINKIRPDLGFQFPILHLEELKLRIEGKPPLRSDYEVDQYLHEVIDRTIDLHPTIKNQLEAFWNAHQDIINNSIVTSESYNPIETAEENVDRIKKIDEEYRFTIKKFRENPNEKMYIYALFYIHVLKTEAIEYSLTDQLGELITRFDLNTKYNPYEIFSVISKVHKTQNKQARFGYEWVTDARAIRDALTHDHYDLKFANNSWTIHLQNHEKGYDFDMTFSKDEFLTYIGDTDLLYKCSMIIIFRIIVGTIIKQHLIEK